MSFVNSVFIGLMFLCGTQASAEPTPLQNDDQMKVMALISSVQTGVEAQYCSKLEDRTLIRMRSQLNVEAQKLNSRDDCYTYTTKEVVTMGSRSERCISISRKFEIKRIHGGTQYSVCN